MKRFLSIICVLLALISCMAVSASASSPGVVLDPVPYSFDSEYRFSYADARLAGWGYGYGQNFSLTKNFGDSKPTFYYISADQYSDQEFVMALSTPDFMHYDFMDVQLQLDISSISSISCNFGSQSVPFEKSFISSYGFEGQQYIVTLRLDLRGLDRSYGYNPQIEIRGMCHFDQTSMVALLACNGLTIINDPELDFFDSILVALSDMHTNISHWFDLQIRTFGSLFTDLKSFLDDMLLQIDDSLVSIYSYLIAGFQYQNEKLETWFNDLEASFDATIQKAVNAIKGDSSPGDAFGQQVDQKTEELQNMGEVFDSVDRPDVGSVQMNVDAYLSPEDLHMATAGLSSAISSGPILSIFMMALIMATVGYILYGKK